MEGGVEVMGKEIFHEAQRKMQGLTDQSCYTKADSAPKGPEGALFQISSYQQLGGSIGIVKVH